MNILQRDPDDQVQIIDKDGQVVDGATVPDLADDTFVDMYRHMLTARHFDERAVSLQRQGRMGTYPPLSGQEAAQVGSAYALDATDWIFPSYREHIVANIRGIPLDQILLYWMGDARGNEVPADSNYFTPSVPIATQIPHATGAAWAASRKNDEKVFLVYFGDGATSEGDFHEGMNFGGVFDVPCIYFCNNNQWAISVPRERQTATKTLAQKAHAYGFDGIQVDGMDPLAVYQVTRAAREKALDPPADEARPTLIEAVQYRYGAHTTADDPTVYRDEDEVAKWRDRDPLSRIEVFLRETGRLDDESVEALNQSVKEEVADAIDAAENYPRPHPNDMFEYVFAEVPWTVKEDREYLENLRNRHGDAAFIEN